MWKHLTEALELFASLSLSVTVNVQWGGFWHWQLLVACLSYLLRFHSPKNSGET